MSLQYPNYLDYEDDYERHYQKLTKGPFLDQISMDEAESYLYHNIITTNLINYTFKYIQSQIHKNITLETYIVQHPSQFEEIRTRIPQYAIVITFKGMKYGGMLWDTLNEQIFLINGNSQLEDAFTDQQIYHIKSYSKDLLSVIAAVFIRILNDKNKDLSKIDSIFQECLDHALIKWVLLKQYRIKQMKQKGESYSRILDDNFLKDINSSQSHSNLKSKKQTYLLPLTEMNNQSKSFSELAQADNQLENKRRQPSSQSRHRSLIKIDNHPNLGQEHGQKQAQAQKQVYGQQQEYQKKQLEFMQKQEYQYKQKQIQIQQQEQEQKQQNQNYKQNQTLSLNKTPKAYQINIQEPSNDNIDFIKESISVKDFLDGMNNLKQHIVKKDPKDQNIATTYPYYSPEQVLKLKFDDLEGMLQDQVKGNKNSMNYTKPIEKLLHLLKYYSKYNPYQYEIIVNQYSDFIQDKLLENIGLPRAVQNTHKTFQSSPIPTSKSIGRDMKMDQDPVIDLKFNQKIYLTEYNQLKDSLILSQNIMDIYFKYLQETFQRVLILPLEFYQVLSQNVVKARSFTDRYQGRNNTIFDLFDQIFIPIQLTKNEYVGVYIDFNYKIMYYINTLERTERKYPLRVEILDMPIMQFIVKFIKNEYNVKVMKSFNILNWKFVEFQNEYAQDITHGGLVLVYIIDSICNHENVLGNTQRLKMFMSKILVVIKKLRIER
ncbi:unnamed protein product (macronuclear) [Paramecium tetraurelia]|uniref:Ubiquitin-like protease family profile domain-containing protein n=1 Tax=Paramecium tetraurelia TaxID=5888 RepID=A0CZC7_PARTE|nr:uncharacterized protein GSPATT00011717001 [Paramecium tetraurelia]CAK76144.1 unnamed protein product [Paramecium tetraurelia]|eukprot:XP_001443541.1 hypothetical protein (macronuclear) [Paramecium tetraurelia strain d4-2]